MISVETVEFMTVSHKKVAAFVSRAYYLFEKMVDAHCVRDSMGVSPYIGWLRFIGLGLYLVYHLKGMSAIFLNK